MLSFIARNWRMWFWELSREVPNPYCVTQELWPGGVAMGGSCSPSTRFLFQGRLNWLGQT